MRFEAQFLNDIPITGEITELWTNQEKQWTSMLAILHSDYHNSKSYAAIELEDNNVINCHHIPAHYVKNWKPMSHIKLYACITTTGSPYHRFKIMEDN